MRGRTSFLPQFYFDNNLTLSDIVDKRANLKDQKKIIKEVKMNEDKKVEVYPFLDWSLVQAGRVVFTDYIKRKLLASPQPYNVPYGISISSQKAKKTAFWLKAEKPWETMHINGYITVMYEDGIYRLWYESVASGYYDDGVQLCMDSKLCYAESTDGLNWKKPILNLVEYEGDKKTNIVFDKNSNGGFGYHGGTVFLDPVAPSSERYKLIYWSGGKDGSEVIRGAVSKDGLLWKPIPGPLLNNYMSDTQTVAYYDRKMGAYVGYFRIGGGGRRAIARAETKDFKKWPVPKTILSLGVNYHPSHDLYTNAHVLYPGRDDLHLMFPAQYDREKDSLEVYLATSRDGVKWEYFGKNPVLPLGGKGGGQEERIYAGCGLVPLKGDNLGLPCCSFSYTHNDFLPRIKSYSGCYFWATWEKDRLVAIEASEKGSFSLPVFSHQVSKLHLNFSTEPAGEIRVQISEQISTEEAKPVSGYTFSDCSPICGDEVRYPVRWRGKTEISASQAKPLAIQFKMNQSKLFALYIER